jgi:hypothetical protein
MASGRCLRLLPVGQLGQVMLDGRLVKSLCLTLLDGQRSFGAFTDAGTKPIAEALLDDAGLAVDDLQRALFARYDALAAASAQRLVNADDLPGLRHR